MSLWSSTLKPLVKDFMKPESIRNMALTNAVTAPVAALWPTGGKKQPAAAPGGGGGAEGGAGGGSDGASLSDIFAEFLKWNPQYAEQNWQLTDKYEPLYAALAQRLTGQERTSDMSDVLRLAPELQKIQKASERPDAAAIRDLLFKQIGDELAMGGALTPEQSRATNESIRSGQIARGVSAGTGAANRESVARALEGMKLLSERQQKGMGLLSMQQSQQGDPYSVILGRSPTSVNLAASQSAAGAPGANFFATNYWNAENLGFAKDKYNLGLSLAQQQYANL